MATRSRIGIQLPQGQIVSVYSHWDGYPEHNGKILKAKYTTIDSVTELIDGGDISSLETKTTWESTYTDGSYTNTREEQPLYYFERGENDVEPQLSKNLKQFFKLTKDCGGEYSYLYRNGTWLCFNDKNKLVDIPE